MHKSPTKKAEKMITQKLELLGPNPYEDKLPVVNMTPQHKKLNTPGGTDIHLTPKLQTLKT